VVGTLFFNVRVRRRLLFVLTDTSTLAVAIDRKAVVHRAAGGND